MATNNKFYFYMETKGRGWTKSINFEYADPLTLMARLRSYAEIIRKFRKLRLHIKFECVGVLFWMILGSYPFWNFKISYRDISALEHVYALKIRLKAAVLKWP